MPKKINKNFEIVKERMISYNKIKGARVGDFLKLDNDNYTRFTHDWGDGIQVGGENGSFYLGKEGISYSGGLDPCISHSELKNTGKEKVGDIWIFQDDYHNDSGITFSVKFRVFEEI